MPPAVTAFYTYALNVSRQSGIFYSDARRDGWEFGVSKNTTHRWARYLESEGWFRRIDRGLCLRRNPLTGSYESIRYTVVDHDTWAQTHRGRCRLADGSPYHKQTRALNQNAGQNMIAPVLIVDRPVPINEAASTTLHLPPVPIIGTKSELSQSYQSEKKSEPRGTQNHNRKGRCDLT